MNPHPRRFTALAVAAVTACCLFADRVQVTEATWQETRTAAATFAADVVPPPVIVSCQATPALLGLDPTVVLVIQTPSGGPYSLHFFAGVGGLLPSLLTPFLGSATTVPGPQANQTTTTLRSGVLTGLLGGTITVGVAHGLNGWQSVRVGRTATFAGLGLGATCTA